MREKDIDEMAKCICQSRGIEGIESCKECDVNGICLYHDISESIYNAGYRKQIEGEWHWIADDSPMCNICGKVFDTNDDADAGLWNFCPNCGAKMRKEDERK